MAVCTARARNGRISTSGLKSDVRQHRDPRPRFLLRRGNIGNLKINKGYIAYFSLRMRERAELPFPVYNLT